MRTLWTHAEVSHRMYKSMQSNYNSPFHHSMLHGAQIQNKIKQNHSSLSLSTTRVYLEMLSVPWGRPEHSKSCQCTYNSCDAQGHCGHWGCDSSSLWVKEIRTILDFIPHLATMDYSIVKMPLHTITLLVLVVDGSSLLSLALFLWDKEG
jgi:hypothetical protein